MVRREPAIRLLPFLYPRLKFPSEVWAPSCSYNTFQNPSSRTLGSSGALWAKCMCHSQKFLRQSQICFSNWEELRKICRKSTSKWSKKAFFPLTRLIKTMKKINHNYNSTNIWKHHMLVKTTTGRHFMLQMRITPALSLIILKTFLRSAAVTGLQGAASDVRLPKTTNRISSCLLHW